MVKKLNLIVVVLIAISVFIGIISGSWDMFANITMVVLVVVGVRHLIKMGLRNIKR